MNVVLTPIKNNQKLALNFLHVANLVNRTGKIYGINVLYVC